MSERAAASGSGGVATALVGAANMIGRVTGMIAEMVFLPVSSIMSGWTPRAILSERG